MIEDLEVLARLLPWVMRVREGVSVSEVCERFGLDPDRLERLLDEGLMIGVAPFSPNEYLDCQIIEGRVVAQPYAGLDAPPRPTVAEAARAYQAADAVLRILDDEHAVALAGARDALSSFLIDAGLEPSALQADLALPGSDQVPELRRAAADEIRVRITHRKPGADEVTRLVDPYGVFVQDRAWYLDAFDHHSDERRTFRVDRIRTVTRTQEPASRAAMRTRLQVEPSEDAISITLRVEPPARWLAEQISSEDREELSDGSLRLRLRTDDVAWMVPLVCSAGPAVRIEEGEELRIAVRGALEAARSYYA